jgi:ketosteroid isomerase-like protein
MKSLIAFYSRADENYFGGAMRYVKVGNTEIVSGILRDLPGRDDRGICRRRRRRGRDEGRAGLRRRGRRAGEGHPHARPEGAEGMTDDRAEIEQLYRRYWRCMIEKDVDGLRAMMAKDYCLMHMTGVKQSADEFLRGLSRGTFNYYAAEHDAVDVTLRGDTAEMVGRSRVEAAVYGGGRHLWRLRGDFTLRKENGAWKLVSSEASTY